MYRTHCLTAGSLSEQQKQGRNEIMAEISTQATFPRWFLIGASALILSSLVIAGVARTTGFGTSRVAQTPVASSVDIRFVELANGSMRVLRAEDGAELALLASDGSGFLRGIARSLFRQRLLGKVDRNEPFQLGQRIDGKYFILDAALASRVELDGFGPTNTQSIADVLNAGLRPQSALLTQSTSQQGPSVMAYERTR
jgi:putative photosynthetic complex assembly protein